MSSLGLAAVFAGFAGFVGLVLRFAGRLVVFDFDRACFVTPLSYVVRYLRRMQRALLVLLMVNCGGSERELPPTDTADLLATLEELAAMGEKQPGTPAGQQAAQYIADRFEAIGLS